MNISPVNENTIIVYFSDTVNLETADKISIAVTALRRRLSTHIIDVIPSYTSILISFDLLTIDLKTFMEAVNYTLSLCEKRKVKSMGKVIELPVYYGLEVALDADHISAYTGLSFDEVVNLHSSMSYRVYAIGFAPGFAYLGNTDKRIEIPRKETPRLKVPMGSVAIADRQTAIYPKQSPGGWSVIGKTPVNLIDFEKDNLTEFEVGAQIQFKSIDKETFLEMGGCLFPEESDFKKEEACHYK
ncbi:5-oxoprolinase subunit PxpB [Vibrio litoralis]|uniref:5-oxoprolinase subunit PxpB n=1 Tax=Vibrio litoralis TaxID=335972 RepID=UPI0003FEC643|nr:5-oxoprolinase subunit PxpB [Vibrio litoralis]